MREIKFHYIYQHGETGRFADLCYTLDEIEKGHPARDASDRFNRYSLVARRQYTGLKDSQGVEIYEGDIVLLEEYYWGDTSKEDALAVTEWHEYDCGFVFRLIESCGGRLHVSEYTSKVVGNKYENPEKLKVWIRREL